MMQCKSTDPLRRTTSVGLLVGLLLAGCSGSERGVDVLQRETWDVNYLQGVRVGYEQTTFRLTDHDGRQVARIEAVQRLAVRRFDQQTEQEIQLSSIETPDGELIEFRTEIQQGTVPMQTVGRVVGDRLEFETTTRGKSISTSIPWSTEFGGFFAPEQTLLRRPMQPGERRTLRALVPVLNQVATFEMTAVDYEPVRLLSGSHELLRIETVMHLGDGQTLPMVVWCDRTGESLKSRSEAMGLENYRTTKALALQQTEVAELDLGRDIAVRVERPLASAHQTKRIRYRVQLEDDDPAGVFISGPSQQIKSAGPNTAEVTVYALRPGQPGGNPDAHDDPPTDDHREPNNMIQSDYPKIVALAQEAAGREEDPWQVARALERYVNRYIEDVAFSQAFATAAEVADDPVGDCTEHAVLLAALARARGIPARTAVGLVYVQSQQSFGYHMWTEVYIQGRWIPIDATLAQGGIGAAHLKVAHSTLKGATAYSSFLPIIRVIGRLKIDVEEVE